MRRLLLQTPEITVADVPCSGSEAGWSRPEVTHCLNLVLVRRGLFQRRCAGTVLLADATCGYLAAPGSVAEFAHPGGGDACTSLEVSEALTAMLLSGDPVVTDRALPTSSATDLAHRMFTARARQGAGTEELAERAVMMVARLLASLEPRRTAARRPSTEQARRRLVDETRALLHDDLSTRLVDVARRLRISPYHLSRIFHQATGMAIHQYRSRLRARRALELIADGETGLAGVAAEVGFADQAHLTRVVRTELGITPGRLRALLGPRSRSLA